MLILSNSPVSTEDNQGNVMWIYFKLKLYQFCLFVVCLNQTCGIILSWTCKVFWEVYKLPCMEEDSGQLWRMKEAQTLSTIF